MRALHSNSSGASRELRDAALVAPDAVWERARPLRGTTDSEALRALARIESRAIIGRSTIHHFNLISADRIQSHPFGGCELTQGQVKDLTVDFWPDLTTCEARRENDVRSSSDPSDGVVASRAAP